MKAVLLVDDDLPLRKSVRELLERNGATVFEAGSSDEALACIARNAAIGLVLLELDLANDDGLKFLAAKRKSPELPAIVLLTRCGSDEVSRTNVEMFLQKPVSAEMLLNIFEFSCGDAEVVPVESKPRFTPPPRPRF